MNIFIYGSIAFDIIFSINDDFRKSIPLIDGKIKNFNATYLAKEKKEFPGGTAGNIGFWLGQEKIGATIFSAWGKDFSQKKYQQKLENLGIKIVGYEGDFTANAYIISDPLHQQLTIWQPNTYEKKLELNLKNYFSDNELQKFQYAIFSAGTSDSITKHIQEFRKKNKQAKIIFDPGQVSQFFSKENFCTCLKNSDILIGNDVEFEYFKKFGIDDNLIQIETLGEKGIRLKKDGKEKFFQSKKVENVVETTGAGDAFRAGFLSVFFQKEDWDAAIKKGCELGAKCVKLSSAQF